MPGISIGRIVGIPLGVISLLLLATHAFNVQYTAVFHELLTWLENEVGPYFEPFEKLLKQIVAGVGIDLHLQRHWRYAFVLIWLLVGSIAKTLGRNGGWIPWLALNCGAALISLVAGAAAGSVPLDRSAVFAWPFAVVTFSLAIVEIMVWRSRLSAAFGILLTASLVGLGFYDTAPNKDDVLSWFGVVTDVPSHGLLDLLVLVGGLGVIGLIISAWYALFSERRSEAGFWRRLDSDVGSVGIDVLSTLGIALFTGYILAA